MDVNGYISEATGGQEAAKPVDTGAAQGEITVWAMGSEGEKLGELAKDFEAANPGAKVTVTAIPWDAAHDKIATAIAGRQTPDMSLVGTTYMAEFARSGALDPTPPLINGADFFPGGWETTVVNGTSYGVPWYVETRLLYYRADLARRAGVTPPADWNGLTAFAQAMKSKSGAKWAGRGVHNGRQAVHFGQSGDGAGAGVLPVVLRRAAHAGHPAAAGRAGTVVRGRHVRRVLLRAVAHLAGARAGRRGLRRKLDGGTDAERVVKGVSSPADAARQMQAQATSIGTGL